MTKQLKRLIAACAVFLLLAIGVAAAFFIGTTDAPSKDGIKLISADKNAISSVVFNNGEQDTEITLSGGAYSIPSFIFLKVSPTAADSLFTTLSNVTAKQEVLLDVAIDKPLYGLDKPYSGFTVKLTDNTQYEVLFGNVSPTNTERYALMNDKLYLVECSIADSVHKSAYDFAEKQITKPAESGENITFASITQNGQTMAFEYVAEATDPGSGDAQTDTAAHYNMTSPFPAMVKATDVQSVINGIFGISASGIKAEMPTAEQLSACGFDNPLSVLKATTSTGASYTLTVAKQDTEYYLTCNDIPVIYNVVSTSLSFIDTTPETLFKSVFPGKTADMIASAAINTTDLQVDIVKNGKDFTAKDLTSETAKAVLTAILDMPPEKVQAPKAYTLPEAAVITLQYMEGGTDILRLIPDGNGKLYMELNGACAYCTTETQLTDILARLQK